MYRMLTQAQDIWVDKTGLLTTNSDCHYYHLECFYKSVVIRTAII